MDSGGWGLIEIGARLRVNLLQTLARLALSHRDIKLSPPSKESSVADEDHEIVIDTIGLMHYSFSLNFNGKLFLLWIILSLYFNSA